MTNNADISSDTSVDDIINDITASVENPSEKHTDNIDYSPQNSYVEIEEEGYPAGVVMQRLGISKDSLRYITDVYEEFIHPKRAKNGTGVHKRYTAEDISTIETIQALKNKGYSNPDIKSFLRDPSTHIIVAGADNNEALIKGILENNQKLIEEFTNATSLILERALKQQADIYDKQLALSDDEHNKKLDKVEQLLDKVLAENQAIQKENHELKNMVEDIKNKLQEAPQEPSKKKKFFGLFG